MLGSSALVMRSLDLKAHFFQIQADLTAGQFTHVRGAQVKVTGGIVGLGCGVAVLVGVEQEELALGAYIKGKAHFFSLTDGLFQNVAGVSLEGSAVRLVYIADQPGDTAMLGVPGIQREGIQIRTQVHIGFFDTHKALDRGTVEHALVIQRFFGLACGDGNILQRTKDIGELKANKLYVFFLNNAENVLF